MKNHSRPLLITLILLSGALLAYTTARAILLSMTHDESSTFWTRGVDVLSCFFLADCWGNANLHPLNTWLLQQSEALFGVSELSLRLPNLLAHILYLVASARLILQLNTHFLISVAGFMLLNFNPYVLDFFSLARGYGLSTGLTMASVVALFVYLQREHWSILALSYGLAFLAVMANFVALNYLVSLWGTVLLMSLLRPIDGRVRLSVQWRRQVWMNAMPVGVSLLLAVLLYTPIRHLQGGGEFLYGAQRFGETFSALVMHSLYGVTYFGKETAPIFSALYTLAILASLTGACWFFLQRPEEQWRQYYLATAFLFLLSCLVMIAQHYLLGSNYLLDRKSLTFFILSGLLLYFLLYGLGQVLGIWFGTMVSGVIILTIFYHSFRTANFEYCREWWYDRHTKEMVVYLNEISPTHSTGLRLGVSWPFQPSTSFYLHHLNIGKFATPTMDSSLYTDSRYDFYYVFGGEYEQLKERYEIVRHFPSGMYLLRKKDAGR